MLRTMHRTPILSLVAFALAAPTVASCGGELPQVEGDATVSAVPPPPISGGTLIVSRDWQRAIAADPDRDRVWVVHLLDAVVEHAIALERGDEPGRLVEDAAGRVHVALRRGGAVVSIDPLAGTILRRASVCPEPRGLAHDEAQDLLHVACAGGEFVTLDAGTLAESRRLALDSDLRDVVIDGDSLLVSRFRSSELLVVAADGTVASRLAPPPLSYIEDMIESVPPGHALEPNVAYRMLPWPGGGALMVHQRSTTAPLAMKAPEEGQDPSRGLDEFVTDECGFVVQGTVSRFRAPGDGSGPVAAPAGPAIGLAGALPVDMAITDDGGRIAVLMAGNSGVVEIDPSLLDAAEDEDLAYIAGTCQLGWGPVPGTPIAIAFRRQLVIQTREPPAIVWEGGQIDLPGEDVSDAGHDLFHRSPVSGALACASCHPEAREDGRVWSFGWGSRRTPSLVGGILDTLPLYRDGSMGDMGAIVDDVFMGRMGGEDPGPRHVGALGVWLDAQPAPVPARDAADPAAVRGNAIFESEAVGCATCHSGPMLTNNRNEDIGTGASLQVPSLIGVGARAPLMHDGCAGTLRDVFDPACGGPTHGSIEGLDAQATDDLIAFLESL